MISAEVELESKHESKTGSSMRLCMSSAVRATPPRESRIFAKLPGYQGELLPSFRQQGRVGTRGHQISDEGTDALFASAPYCNHPDGHHGGGVYEKHPAIRDACNRGISEHASTLVSDMKRLSGNVESKGSGQRKTSPSTRRLPSRARSFWPRQHMMRRSRPNASTTFVVISSSFLLNPGRRRFEPLPSNE